MDAHQSRSEKHGPEPVHIDLEGGGADNGAVVKKVGRPEHLSRINEAAAAVTDAIGAAVDEYELRHDHTLAALEVLRERQQANDDQMAKVVHEQGELNRGVAQVIANQKGGVEAYNKLTGSIKTITDQQAENARKLDKLEVDVQRLRQLVTTLTVITTVAVVGLVVVVILGAASMFAG